MKIRKYNDLLHFHDFCPVANETLGRDWEREPPLYKVTLVKHRFLFQLNNAIQGTVLGSEDVTE